MDYVGWAIVRHFMLHTYIYIYTYSRTIIKYLKNTKRNSWCRKNNYVTHWEHAIWKSVYSHSEDWDFISKVDKNVFIFSKEIKYPLSTFFSFSINYLTLITQRLQNSNM